MHERSCVAQQSPGRNRQSTPAPYRNGVGTVVPRAVAAPWVQLGRRGDTRMASRTHGSGAATDGSTQLPGARAVWRNSVSSIHIRWSTTESRRATATVAVRQPRLAAIDRPHDFKYESRVRWRRIDCAARYKALLAALSPQ